MDEMVRKGCFVCFIRLAELLAVCDRIITIYDGRITGEMDRSKIDSEEELQYAIQQNKKNIQWDKYMVYIIFTAVFILFALILGNKGFCSPGT